MMGMIGCTVGMDRAEKDERVSSALILQGLPPFRVVIPPRWPKI